MPSTRTIEHTIEHTIEIDAPIAAVWALTVDIEAWPTMTPTMTSVERLDHGPLQPASTAKVKQPGQRATVWTVATVEPERRFAWSASVFGTEMTAAHTLTAKGTTTTNVLTITLAGRTAGLMARLAGGRIAQALATENAGFKQAAEAARLRP